MKNHVLPSTLVLAGFLAFCGCAPGGGDAPPTVKVSGKITYGGGEWPTTAKPTLSFTPVVEAGGNEKVHSGQADVKTNGDFAATTTNPGDGLVPGKYQVAVQAWDPPGGPADNPSAKSLVPKQYEVGATSGFVVDVPAGSGPITVPPFDVPKAP